jgi:hypothetical protein
MLPVVCVGDDTGFEFETHAVVASINQKIYLGAGVSTVEIKCAAGALQLFERGDLQWTINSVDDGQCLVR